MNSRCMAALSAAWMLSLPACGGGGGATLPPSTTTRLTAADLLLNGPEAAGDLVVRLAEAPATGPTLLQVAIELPPQLTVAANDRLRPIAPMPDLDGDFVDDRFVVLCGDGQNQNGQPLQPGDLFRLRLLASTPRQPGNYTVRLVQMRAATADGQELNVAAEPATATVTVQ